MKQWFYARGGQQSGPVSDAQVRELLRNGGLDPEKDLVWHSGMTDWLPPAKVPELSPAPAIGTADPSNPYAAPSSAWNEPDQIIRGQALEEITPGSEPFDAVACVKRGFDLTVRNFGMILLVGIVYFAITFGLSIVLELLGVMLGFATGEMKNFEDATTQSVSGIQIAYGLVSMLITQLVSILLSLGSIRIGLNIVSGKEFSVGMLFGEGRKLLRAVGASILFGIMFFVGIICLIVPGIYVALRFGQYMNAIVDRDMGIMESFRYSSAITTNNRMNLFLIFLMGIGLMIAGCLALVIGLVFAYPVIWLSWFVAYRWMQYGHRAALDHPGTRLPMLSNPQGWN